jgi:hypothetical protein
MLNLVELTHVLIIEDLMGMNACVSSMNSKIEKILKKKERNTPSVS